MDRKRAAIRVALCALFFAALGYLIAHYYPVLSSDAVERICQPFSPCRSEGAPAYVIGGLRLGAVLGAVSVRATRKKRRP